MVLFSDTSILDVFRAQEQGIQEYVTQLPDAKIRDTPREDLVSEIFERFRLDAPVLKEKEIATEKENTQIDVSQDTSRMISDPSRPYYIPGTKFLFHVPYVGEHQFFQYQPRSYSMTPMRGDVGDAELVWMCEVADPDPQRIRTAFDQWLESVRTNLRTLSTNCQEFNGGLEATILQVLNARIQRLLKADDALTQLGFPERQIIEEPAEETGRTTPTKDDQFDAFICHSSDDKGNLVRPLAERLKSLGYKIWYDEFELTVGDSLRQSIDKGLARSRYGIVVLSPTFVGKGWTNYELDGLLAKEIGKRKVILPIWHQIGRNEVLAYSPSLSDKVALDSNLGINQLAAKLANVLKQES